MKRSLSVIVTAAMVLSLAACGVQAPETPAATEAPAETEALDFMEAFSGGHYF